MTCTALAPTRVIHFRPLFLRVHFVVSIVCVAIVPRTRPMSLPPPRSLLLSCFPVERTHCIRWWWRHSPPPTPHRPTRLSRTSAPKGSLGDSCISATEKRYRRRSNTCDRHSFTGCFCRLPCQMPPMLPTLAHRSLLPPRKTVFFRRGTAPCCVVPSPTFPTPLFLLLQTTPSATSCTALRLHTSPPWPRYGTADICWIPSYG